MKAKALSLYLTSAFFGAAISLQANLIDSHGPYYDSPNGGNPLPFGQILVASGGDVTLTFLGPTTAIYNDVVLLVSPANSIGTFFANHSTANGTTIDLGSYAAGTEIEFGLYVFNTGLTWYNGPGDRNSDGHVHTYMLNNYEGLADTTYIGFEDLAADAGADWNYVDDIYAVTGANAVDVPEITFTAGLLGLGLFSLMTVRKLGHKFSW